MGLLIGMLLGIQYIHANGIIHRDLKPENILLDNAGNAKIGDFGTSRSVKYSYTVPGTLPYISPEALKGEKYGANTDIWSLGCIVHELCCLKVLLLKVLILLQPPYFSDDLNKQVALITKKPYDPNTLPKEYSTQLRLLIESMLIQDQKLRPSVEKLLGTELIVHHLSKTVAKMGTIRSIHHLIGLGREENKEVNMHELIEEGRKLYPNGNRYEGQLLNGKREGKGQFLVLFLTAIGTYYYANGNKYDGEWKDDKITKQMEKVFVWNMMENGKMTKRMEKVFTLL
eukprot:TRINITY_DN1296_c1_g1_i6.p1 TRINITY_DN1296_c1_g1~~TRINITY_DN1296_c1_g1_i6.p1  ORF type:complete len:285 (+),score=25.57 TRINITY_DN1296_c1_g1_i6:1140-1994(+)